MNSIEINETLTPLREFTLVQGDARQLRSPYYQQLIMYNRSLIRTLNSPGLSEDLESYCYRQMWITRLEMVKFRQTFQRSTYTEEPPNGPHVS
jgi:hypothetical protein